MDQGRRAWLRGAGALAAAAMAGGGALPAQAAVQRPFHMGFTAFATQPDLQGWLQAYDVIGGHADLVTHFHQDGIPWSLAYASADSLTYPFTLQYVWQQWEALDAAFAPRHVRNLAVNFINHGYTGLALDWGTAHNQPLPAPWSSSGFGDAHVQWAAVNFAKALIARFKPRYFGIGIESNILLARRPDLWDGYKRFAATLYTALKHAHPEVLFYNSLQYEHLTGKFGDSARLQSALAATYPDVLRNEARELMRHADFIAVSTYPYMVYDNPVGESYFDPLLSFAAGIGKPLAIEQTGFTTQPLRINEIDLPGSDAAQVAYLQRLLQLAFSQRFLFVNQFVPVDYGLNYGTAPESLAWAYVGMRRGDLSDKPALALWDFYKGIPHFSG